MFDYTVYTGKEAETNNRILDGSRKIVVDIKNATMIILDCSRKARRQVVGEFHAEHIG